MPPADGVERVGRAVSALAAFERPMVAAYAAGGRAFDVSAPLPIYSLGKPDSSSKPSDLLDRARFVGWRYLVFGGPIAYVADLRQEGTAKKPKLVRSPELASNVLKAGRLAEKVINSDASYDVRLLDLDLLGHSALWLVSEDIAKPDHFVSLGGKPREIDARQFLEEVSAAERAKAVTFASTSGESGG
jgi:hypothetical protein